VGTKDTYAMCVVTLSGTTSRGTITSDVSGGTSFSKRSRIRDRISDVLPTPPREREREGGRGEGMREWRWRDFGSVLRSPTRRIRTASRIDLGLKLQY